MSEIIIAVVKYRYVISAKRRCYQKGVTKGAEETTKRKRRKEREERERERGRERERETVFTLFFCVRCGRSYSDCLLLLLLWLW
jgi:hypothetical protein